MCEHNILQVFIFMGSTFTLVGLILHMICNNLLD